MGCACPAPADNRSTAEKLAALSDAEKAKVLDGLSPAEMDALLWDWKFWGRPKQHEPSCNWHIWLALAGRGFGKTRTGVEWLRSMVCGSTPLGAGKVSRVGIIGQTTGDVRGVMIEGESGILAKHPPGFRPLYEPSKRKLTWPNGAVADLFNGTEPDQMRGFQFEIAWLDELAKMQYMQAVWDELQLCLRLGTNPRAIVTTTPRPIPLLRKIVAATSTHVTSGSSYENESNLPASWFDTIREKYEGTRLGRQELEAEILDDNPFGLFQQADIDGARVKNRRDVPDLIRLGVSIDPNVTQSEANNESGIIVGGAAANNEYYILEDATMKAASPAEWAAQAVGCYYKHHADFIVVETNQGGDLVEQTIRNEDPSVAIVKVHASRGKVIRAEPISALYEQRRVHHVGVHADLEQQMTDFTSDFDVKKAGYSPDRLDALVWLLTQLSTRHKSGRPRARRL